MVKQISQQEIIKQAQEARKQLELEYHAEDLFDEIGQALSKYAPQDAQALSWLLAYRKIFIYWECIALANYQNHLQFVIPSEDIVTLDNLKDDILKNPKENRYQYGHSYGNLNFYRLPNKNYVRFHTQHNHYDMGGNYPTETINNTIKNFIGQYFDIYKLSRNEDRLDDFFSHCRYETGCLEAESQKLAQYALQLIAPSFEDSVSLCYQKLLREHGKADESELRGLLHKNLIGKTYTNLKDERQIISADDLDTYLERVLNWSTSSSADTTAKTRKITTPVVRTNRPSMFPPPPSVTSRPKLQSKDKVFCAIS